MTGNMASKVMSRSRAAAIPDRYALLPCPKAVAIEVSRPRPVPSWSTTPPPEVSGVHGGLGHASPAAPGNSGGASVVIGGSLLRGEHRPGRQPAVPLRGQLGDHRAQPVHHV